MHLIIDDYPLVHRRGSLLFSGALMPVLILLLGTIAITIIEVDNVFGQSNLKTTIALSTSEVQPGGLIFYSVKVLDGQTDENIEDASVQATINASGLDDAEPVDEETNENGVAFFSAQLDPEDPEGIYDLKFTISKAGYNNETQNTFFVVTDELSEIEDSGNDNDNGNGDANGNSGDNGNSDNDDGNNNNNNDNNNNNE